MKRSTRFLVADATGAAATANAVRPYARSGKLSVASFVCGLPTSELPVQTLILQSAGAALLARKGGRRGVSGAIGVAATAGSLAGLARLHREAVRAADVLEAALTDQLGSDYRRRIRANFIAAPEVPLTRRRILLPDWTARRQYRAERDVSYGEFGRRNLLDVWRRRDVTSDARACAGAGPRGRLGERSQGRPG